MSIEPIKVLGSTNVCAVLISSNLKCCCLRNSFRPLRFRINLAVPSGIGTQCELTFPLQVWSYWPHLRIAWIQLTQNFKRPGLWMEFYTPLTSRLRAPLVAQLSPRLLTSLVCLNWRTGGPLQFKGLVALFVMLVFICRSSPILAIAFADFIFSARFSLYRKVKALILLA